MGSCFIERFGIYERIGIFLFKSFIIFMNRVSAYPAFNYRISGRTVSIITLLLAGVNITAFLFSVCAMNYCCPTDCRIF